MTLVIRKLLGRVVSSISYKHYIYVHLPHFILPGFEIVMSVSESNAADDIGSVYRQLKIKCIRANGSGQRRPNKERGSINFKGERNWQILTVCTKYLLIIPQRVRPWDYRGVNSVSQLTIWHDCIYTA